MRVIARIFFVLCVLPGFGQRYYKIVQKEHCGYIDRAGSTIITIDNDNCQETSTGIAFYKKGDKWNLQTDSNQIATFDTIVPFGHQFYLGKEEKGYQLLSAQDMKLDTLLKADSIRYINLNGEPWLETYSGGHVSLLDSMNHYTFSEGVQELELLGNRWFHVKSEKGWGMQSLDGEVFLKSKYDSIKHYKGGSMTYSEGKVGYKKLLNHLKNKTDFDELFFPAVYDSVSTYGEYFTRLEKDGKVLLYDNDEQTFVSKDFPYQAFPLAHNFHKFKSEGEYALLDSKGKRLTPIKYKSFRYSEPNNRIIFKLGTNYGLMDHLGKEIYAAQAERIYPFSRYGNQDRAVTRYIKGGKQGLLNKKGKAITSPRFSMIKLIELDKAACVKEDKSVSFYTFDTKLGTIKETQELASIKELTELLKDTIVTEQDSIHAKLVKDHGYRYWTLETKINGITNRLLEDPFTILNKVKIKGKDFYRIGSLNEETEIPNDKLFGLVAFNEEHEKDLQIEPVYDDIHVMRKKYFKCYKDSLVEFLSTEGAPLKFGVTTSGYSAQSLYVVGDEKGNKIHPTIFTLNNRGEHLAVVPSKSLKTELYKGAYTEVQVLDSLIFAKSDSTWEVTYGEKEEFLPSNTVRLALQDDLVLSENYQVNHTFYTPSGITTVEFNNVEILSEGNGLVQLLYNDTSYNYLTRDAGLLLDTAVSNASSFVNGYAWIYKNGKYEIIDSIGRVSASVPHKMVFNKYGIAPLNKEGKWGLINAKGVVVQEPEFEQLKRINGTDIFSYRNFEKTTYGILNGQGEKVGKADLEKLKKLKYDCVLILRKGKKGLLDSENGEVLIPAKCIELKLIASEIFVVQMKAWGCYSLKKKDWLLDPKYELIGKFKGGYAPVKGKKENFYIDTDGKVHYKLVKKPVVEGIPAKPKKLAYTFVEEGKYKGVKSLDGKTVVPLHYQEVIVLENGVFLAKSKYSSKVQNIQGKVFLESEKQQNVQLIGDGLIRVVFDDEWKYFDTNTSVWLGIN